MAAKPDITAELAEGGLQSVLGRRLPLLVSCYRIHPSRNASWRSMWSSLCPRCRSVGSGSMKFFDEHGIHDVMGGYPRLLLGPVALPVHQILVGSADGWTGLRSETWKEEEIW